MGSIKSGILLLALGHENYFKMAVNLAASIKYNCPGIPIAIINDGFRGIDSALFDQSVLIQPNIPLHQYKLKIYELTPFDKTLYLDVDMISMIGADWGTLIKQLEGCPFTIMNKVIPEGCIWATSEQVRKESANLEDPILNFYSELIYFEKSREAKMLFSEAQRQLLSGIQHRKFAGDMADELALVLASLKKKVFPHAHNWAPVFWHFREKGRSTLQPYQLKKDFIAYSIGGNVTPAYVKANYNNLVAFYAQKMGIKMPYKVIDKRTYLPVRAKI